MSRKRCSKCRVEKESNQFYRDRHKSDGRKSCCKDCADKVAIRYAKTATCKESQKQYWKTNKGKQVQRRCQLKKKFGITLEEYDRLLEQQSGVCAICGQPETSEDFGGSIRRLAVDHNHKTGEVRGLLCQKCNHAIGLFNDSLGIILSAARYVGSVEN